MARSNDDRVLFVPASKSLPKRPPYSLETRAFLSRCDGCAQCRDVCPKSRIVMDAEGHPVLGGNAQVCGECTLCADVCTRGALSAKPVVPDVRVDRAAIRDLIRAAAPGISARICA